ncbi:MAG: histidine kinase dimerization/phospho-acceptor domain-containing protein, partial [Syntrophothermus sp.]
MFKDSFFENRILDSLVYPILDSSEIGFSIVDKDGLFLEVNDAFCELFGFDRTEIIQNEYSAVVMEENIELARKNHVDFMESGFYHKREILLRQKSGKFFFAQLIDMKFNDENGNVYRATTYHDITEKKQNELVNSVLLKIPQIADASNSMKSMYRNIHASIEQLMPAFNFYIGLYDDDTDSISYPYLTDEFEQEENGGLNTDLYDVITNYVLKNGRSVLLDDKKIENVFLKHKELIYEQKPVAVLGGVLKVKGKVTGVVTLVDFNNTAAFNKIHLQTIEKITEQISHLLERKKYEEQLIISREKAEESNRVKSAFLTQISHEIRTPINTILSFTSLIKEKLGDCRDEETDEYFSVIDRGASRLVRTIDMILSMSQLQNETIEIKPVELELEEVLNPIVEKFRETASKKNLDLHFCNNAEPRTIVGDGISIVKIFEQLIDNAVKYTQAGKIEVEIYNQADKMCVAVKDTGIGISQEYL